MLFSFITPLCRTPLPRSIALRSSHSTALCPPLEPPFPCLCISAPRYCPGPCSTSAALLLLCPAGRGCGAEPWAAVGADVAAVVQFPATLSSLLLITPTSPSGECHLCAMGRHGAKCPHQSRYSSCICADMEQHPVLPQHSIH